MFDSLVQRERRVEIMDCLTSGVCTLGSRASSFLAEELACFLDEWHQEVPVSLDGDGDERFSATAAAMSPTTSSNAGLVASPDVLEQLGTDEMTAELLCAGASTSAGRAVVRQALHHPLHEVRALKARRRRLDQVDAAYHRTAEARQEVDSARARLAMADPVLCWLSDMADGGPDVQERELQVLEQATFPGRLMGVLNEHPALALPLLTAFRVFVAPLVVLLKPLVWLVMGYVAMQIKLGLNLGVRRFVALLFSEACEYATFTSVCMSLGLVLLWLHNLYCALRAAAIVVRVSRQASERLQDVTDALEASEELGALLGGRSPWTTPPPAAAATTMPHLRRLGGVRDTRDAPSPDVCCARALRFARWCVMHPQEARQALLHRLRVGHHLDAAVSVAACRRRLGMCTPRFVAQGAPAAVRARWMWHPHLPRDLAVPNVFELGGGGGGGDCPPGAVVTGPNAGGKSTLLRAVATNVLLAQSVCLCAAKSMRLTPFRRVVTHLTAPRDVVGTASLFEAEMHRCCALVAEVQPQRTDEGKGAGPTLVCIDEMFSCTEPTEGAAAAFAVAKGLLEAGDRCISLMATHFTSLSTLADVLPCQTWRMEATRNELGGISFPYRLLPGTCHQHVALDLMAAKGGLDPRRIEDALAERARLTAEKKRGGRSLAERKDDEKDGGEGGGGDGCCEDDVEEEEESFTSVYHEGECKALASCLTCSTSSTSWD
jgi:MutS domain V